mgnify:CR=1 FL=1
MNINRVDLGSIIGQEGGQGPSDHFASIDNHHRSVVQLISVGGVLVVHNSTVLQHLDDRQRSTGNDRLQVLPPADVADVVVHVETVEVTEPLHVLEWVDAILDVLIMATAKDRVVDEDAVDRVVAVCLDDRLLQSFAVQLSKFEGDPRLSAAAFRHLGVLLRRDVLVGEEGDQLYHEVGLLDAQFDVVAEKIEIFWLEMGISLGKRTYMNFLATCEPVMIWHSI